MLSRRTFLGASAAAVCAAQSKKRNVLFIAVDDMRPDLGCYGNRYVKTPNLDGLASKGVTFLNAYCQQAVCSPSRTSLLTGRRPDTTGVYELQTHFRKNLPDVVTLPQHFRNNGYVTTGLGKLFHNGLDDPESWSIPWWGPGAGAEWNTPQNAALMRKQWERLQATGLKSTAVGPPRSQRGPSWLASDQADEELPDGQTATNAIRALSKLKDKPFFLGVGFIKPHLPFIAPKKYFDLYPKDLVRMTDYAPPPKGVPEIALHNSGELRFYQDIPQQGPIPDDKALELIRGYYAALSFTDAQIGRVVNELDRLGLRDNTVVVVWGDHGWHLGNHGLWNKHTNFELATHSPLIVSAPGKRAAKTSPALVEFVDIYPSLSDLCGLPDPRGTEGSSFAPLIDKPDRKWKSAAFSQYPRGKTMGYSVRTRRYRYTEWRTPGSDDRPVELYDYQKDSDESVNLATLPEHAGLVREMAAKLNAGWQAARPGR
jgi:arylsulfatase A-like enzyme